MRKMFTAAGAAFMLATLTACGGGSDSAEAGALLNTTEAVCDDFAKHAKAGLPAADRAELARSMAELIGNADAELRDAFPMIQRTAAGTDGAYKIAADTFAQACFDAGWDG